MSKTFPRSQGRGEIVASEVPREHFYGIYWSCPGSAARVRRSNSAQPHLGRVRQRSPAFARAPCTQRSLRWVLRWDTACAIQTSFLRFEDNRTRRPQRRGVACGCQFLHRDQLTPRRTEPERAWPWTRLGGRTSRDRPSFVCCDLSQQPICIS